MHYLIIAAVVLMFVAYGLQARKIEDLKDANHTLLNRIRLLRSKNG